MKKILLIASFLTLGYNSSIAQCDADVREAFGSVSSIAIYNSYVAIGAIADAYVDEVYDGPRVAELMTEQTGMIQVVIDYLSKCKTPKSDGLSQDDVEYIKEMIDCLYALKKEAQGLSDYATTGSESAQTMYNDNREKAWDLIESLLGLNQD